MFNIYMYWERNPLTDLWASYIYLGGQSVTRLEKRPILRRSGDWFIQAVRNRSCGTPGGSTHRLTKTEGPLALVGL